METLREGDREESLTEELSLLQVNDHSSSSVSDNFIDKKKYNTMQFALTNARSLPPKIASLTTAFRELDLNFMKVTESWIKNSKDTVRALQDIESAENISLICKNRKTRGGGVCLAFDSNSAKLQKFPLATSNFEVVCGVGKIGGFSRKIAILVAYLPPKYKASEVEGLCDYLADCLEKIKRDMADPYICVGGDFNNRDVSSAFKDFPDMAPLPNLPSRNGNALDLCYANFTEDIYELSSHPPLSTLTGIESDHLILSYNFKIERKHIFVTNERRVRKFSAGSLGCFQTLMARTDWSSLDRKDSSSMVEEFDRIVSCHYDACFPETTIKTRSCDRPWITKRIKSLIRKKKRMYKRIGKNRRWKDFERYTRQEIADNQRRHVDKVRRKALEDNSSKAYHAVVNMISNDVPKKRWTPSELFPDLGEKEVSEACAEFFNGISSEFEQIQPPIAPEVKILPPEPFEIAGRLKAFKKPKGLVPGDYDAKVVNLCADLFALPLHKIFGEVFRSCKWPATWKDETVTIIPKNSAPSSLSETRNLSCTPVFSKLLESFLLEKLRGQVKLNDTQFGGIKGLGVDHFLVETWDEILRAVDAGGKVVNLMSIDFQKAFNRMDHLTCLSRLREKGASEHLVQLVAAFLYQRTMTVKIGAEKSDKRIVNGGAPQGSLLGPFLFCVVSELLAEAAARVDLAAGGGDAEVIEDGGTDRAPNDNSLDGGEDEDEENSSDTEWAVVEREFNFFRRQRVNPLDDSVMSGVEPGELDTYSRPTAKAYIDDFNIVEVIDIGNARRHFTTAKAELKILARGCELIFDEIENEALSIKMRVNAGKTQMLCINQNPNYNCRAFIRHKET